MPSAAEPGATASVDASPSPRDGATTLANVAAKSHALLNERMADANLTYPAGTLVHKKTLEEAYLPMAQLKTGFFCFASSSSQLATTA